MSLPVGTRIRAVPHFIECLRVAQAFLAAQDAGSAARRFESLQAEIVRARELVAFAPTSGRPARFLEARTDWGRFQAEQARRLAAALGLPKLRELVLRRHVLLYAHAECDAALLALRHERQADDRLPDPGR